MTRMASRRRAVCLAAALAVVATPLLPAAQQDRPAFRSNTRLIEVSVVVTNRDGNPAPGLTADDFQVFDNGKPQKVELFSVESAGAAAAVPASAPGRREFSNEVPDVGHVTIILFDQLNSSDLARMNAREHVGRFLEQIRPDDRVGLYVLDGTGMLRVVHDFTSDASSLVRAVSNLRGTGSLAIGAEDEGARLEAELADLLAEERLEEAGGKAMREHYLGRRGEDTINALESIGRYLAGVQSRKNVIWVSSGFPLEAFSYRGRSPTREISRATRSLNDGNVALYTVDARGLIPALSGVPGKLVPTTLSMVQVNQDILHSVSEQTGGRAFINNNDIQGAIRRASDDARMTYLLGYYPTDDRWDGRFHRLEVKVNRPGLQARHRQGYFAVATEKQASAQRTAALNAAVVSPINASGLGMTLRIDPVEGKPSDYRLTIRVQPGAIALEPGGGESRGAIDVIVAQVRADGAEGRSLEKRVDVTVADERLPQFMRDGMSLDHTFTLVPSADRLRVVVRDVRTGAIGAVGLSRQHLQAIVP